MAELFLFSITEGVLSKISSLALQDIITAWNLKSETRKLHNTLSTIKAVILDADEQQSKNHGVREWLEKLKDAVYDIDDLFDDLSTEVSRRNPRNYSGVSVLRKVSSFFSSSNPVCIRFQMSRRVKGLRQRLDEIAADRNKFHFTEQTHLISVENNNPREQTHSFVRASEIIGRDNDKGYILRLVLSSSNEENVSVISIVGIGGLGKTTVVKLVYNDDSVIRFFDLGMWISVSEDFSVGKILEKILKSATGENVGHLDMDQMQKRLADVLNEKRYLLVLDDVWNEDRNKWMELLELLTNCRSGSKIIVTTRSQTIANITSSISSYNLSGLSNDDCLSIFLKCAFKERDDFLPNLVTIAREIVKKCGGVPLAIKTLGSLLYMNRDEQEWLRIKNSDIFEIDQKQTDILPLLRLSYEKLPSHLKQCFAYCSMLTKGVEIPREEFVNLWIAQGFIIQPANGDRQLEDIGNQYFNELLSRFCFRDVKEAFDGEILACKIHDLVHDLAHLVAGSECLDVKSDTMTISERTRHLFIHLSKDEEFPKSLFKLKRLRSFRYGFGTESLNKSFIQSIVLNFRSVKVLILNSLELEELPISIGELKKLKYLDLSNCRNIKCLPNSVCKLGKLQTLNLINCEKFKDLPKNFGNLTGIRTLYLTCQEISLRRKSEQIFSSLRLLLLYKCDFVEIPSQVLKHFVSLRVLRIYDCPKLAHLPEGIKDLAVLEKLWIWNCEELDVFARDGFFGLGKLQSVLLMGLPKLINLPEGIMEKVAKTLKFLRIANCVNFTDVPEWILSFTLLQSLYIEDCPNLVFFPEVVRNHIAKVHISGCSKRSNFLYSQV